MITGTATWRTCLNCDEPTRDWREYGGGFMCAACTEARDEPAAWDDDGVSS